MIKSKILVASAVLALMLAGCGNDDNNTSVSPSPDTTGNTSNIGTDVGNAIDDVGEGVGNAVNDAGNAAGNAVEDMTTQGSNK